jgi:hypothetical protein
MPARGAVVALGCQVSLAARAKFDDRWPARCPRSACRDSLVYSCTCSKLGSRSVVLKVYDKLKISPVKHRSVRREARIMKYLTHKRWGATAAAADQATAAAPCHRHCQLLAPAPRYHCHCWCTNQLAAGSGARQVALQAPQAAARH